MAACKIDDIRAFRRPAWRRLAAVLSIAALAACDILPRDPEQTSAHVARSRTIRVGIAADPQGERQAKPFVRRLARETGATPQLAAGSLEPLLLDLENGDRDLVIAWFDRKTPWATRVALAPPLAVRGDEDHRQELRVAARNGENRWMMRIETLSRLTSESPDA